MLDTFAGKRAVDCHRDASFPFSRLTLNESKPLLLIRGKHHGLPDPDRKSVV